MKKSVNMTSLHQNVENMANTFQILISLLGIAGNLISIWIFRRSCLKKHSYSFYSQILSISDTILLTHLGIHSIAELIYTRDELPVEAFFCSLKLYNGYVLGTISLWMLTLISLDRLVKIVYHNRFIIFKKRWFQVTLVAIIIIYSLIINLTIPTSYEYETVEEDNSTDLMCFLPTDAHGLQSLILLSNFLIASLIINNILNVTIIRYIVRSRRNVVKQRKRSENLSRDRKFALSSVGLNISSFIARMSIVVGIFLSESLSLSFDQTYLVFRVCLVITSLDHSATFLINMLFNSLFSNEFLCMIKLKEKKPMINFRSSS